MKKQIMINIIIENNYYVINTNAWNAMMTDE